MRHTIPILLLAALAGCAAPETPEFTPLFDGKSLDGWVTKGGRYDGEARWSVEEGNIVGREGIDHAGGLLYTARMYRDFEFECEAFVTYPFDSGVFVRMVPRETGLKGAQVTLDYRPDGEIAGIYADGWLMHNESVKAKWKRAAWNEVRVRCTGRLRLEVWLNGEKVTDYRLPADKAADYAGEGRVGLQVHGNRTDPEGSLVKFRRLRIREL